jgi:hypothetical protein
MRIRKREQVRIGGGAVWSKAEGKGTSRFLREGGRRQSVDELLHAEEVRARREEGVGRRWAAPRKKGEGEKVGPQGRKREGLEPRGFRVRGFLLFSFSFETFSFFFCF